MDEQELKSKLKQAVENYEAEKNKIYLEFARANNPYKIGDVVTDHMGALRIEKITVSVWDSYPSCVYHGVRLTKAGEPSKKETAPVHQINIIK